MTELSEHYMRVRDYARRFSLDESTVYRMIERGEIKAIRIGKKTLRIPSSELERYLEREPTTDPEVAPLEERVEAFRRANGKDPGPFVDAWRSGEIEDTTVVYCTADDLLPEKPGNARCRVTAAV